MFIMSCPQSTSANCSAQSTSSSWSPLPASLNVWSSNLDDTNTFPLLNKLRASPEFHAVVAGQDRNKVNRAQAETIWVSRNDSSARGARDGSSSLSTKISFERADNLEFSILSSTTKEAYVWSRLDVDTFFPPPSAYPVYSPANIRQDITSTSTRLNRCLTRLKRLLAPNSSSTFTRPRRQAQPLCHHQRRVSWSWNRPSWIDLPTASSTSSLTAESEVSFLSIHDNQATTKSRCSSLSLPSTFLSEDQLRATGIEKEPSRSEPVEQSKAQNTGDQQRGRYRHSFHDTTTRKRRLSNSSILFQRRFTTSLDLEFEPARWSFDELEVGAEAGGVPYVTRVKDRLAEGQDRKRQSGHWRFPRRRRPSGKKKAGEAID